MASFDDALEDMANLLCCPLCGDRLQSTVTVKECGHHFCRKCIYPKLGTLCKCPTCGIPARVGNLLKNPSYDILVACTAKLRDLRLLQHSQEASQQLHRDSFARSGREAGESGTPLGSLLWTYDCGPTFSNSVPMSSSSNIDVQTFPSLNTALVTHRKDRERAIHLRAMTVQANEQQTEDRGPQSQLETHNGARDDTTRQSALEPCDQALSSSSSSQSQNQRGNEGTVIQGSQEREPPQSYGELAGKSATARTSPPFLRVQHAPAIESPQVLDQAVPTHDHATQPSDRQSRKRRIFSEEVQSDQRRPRSGESSSPKRRSGDLFGAAWTLSEAPEPSRAAGFDNKHSVPTAELDAGLVVESSQPSLDMMLPSLMPYARISSRSKESPSSVHDLTNDAGAVSEDTISTSRSSSPVRSARDGLRQKVITCMFTGLGKDSREAFEKNISRVIEAGLLMEHIQDQRLSESTTHIVTSADSSVLKQKGIALCPRVLKYLHGMLSSPWIVRHEWFLESIEAGVWLRPTNYLIQGDTQFGPAPGTQRRREIRKRRSLRLFDSCRMFFYGTFGSSGQKAFTKDELLRLVRDGGAETWLRRPTAKTSLPSSSPFPSGSREISAGGDSSSQTHFSQDRIQLYIGENIKPWEVSIDRSAPIIVCDPSSIPSGNAAKKGGKGGLLGSQTMTLSQSGLKKHGWLREHQAVSLTWILNCISCSLMGAEDIELLYGSEAGISAEEEIYQLSEAWETWRDQKVNASEN